MTKILALISALLVAPASLIYASPAPITVFPRLSSSTESSPPQNSDTIKVIAIRVEFQHDTMSGTTGDGSFGSGIADTFLVDPLPHNNKYFQDQLLFLKNFYETHSNGEIYLDISNAVYPLNDNTAYQLPYPMWHYNHNDDDYLDYGLAALFYDAWKAADTQNGDIDFSQYDPTSDLFVIFHAGVGKDFAFDYDPTPFDIPSAYINYQDLAEELPDSIVIGEGISVDNGAAFVKKGLILPECENQEGYELGMHGHMVLLFGHHIGIPNLYNTEDGTSVLGWFGMMDQGSGKLDGLVPAPPTAWIKVYKEWAEAEEVTSFPSTVDVPVGKIIKVPITDKEYFLIENIDSWVRPEVSWDSLGYSYYVESDEYPRTFELLRDSVSQYMNVEIDPVSGVLTNIGNWGIGRPASGLLIWHIDENVINAGISDNTINNDPDHLGVFLEEADGAHDIGQDYTIFSAGYGTELGYPWDAFWGDNDYHKEANPHKNGVVSFGDDTFPDAKSNSGALSHLVFSDFSMVISDTMSFTVDNDYLFNISPLNDSHSWVSDPFPVDIDGIPGDELLISESVVTNCFRSDGTGLPVKNGSSLSQTLYQFTTIPDRITAFDFDNDGAEELAVLKKTGGGMGWWGDPPPIEFSLHVIDYNPADSTVVQNTDGQTFEAANYLFAEAIIATAENRVYANFDHLLICWEIQNNIPSIAWIDTLFSSSSNSIAADDSGSAAGMISIGGPYYDMCLTPEDELVIISSYGDGARKYASDGSLIFDIDLFDSASDSFIYNYPPAVGDIDRDGEVEIIFISEQNYNFNTPSKVYLMALNSDGSFQEGYPLLLDDKAEFWQYSSPLSLFDIDNDGYLDIIFSIEGEGVAAYEYNGVRSDQLDYSGNSANASILIGSDNSGNPVFITNGENDLRAFDKFGSQMPGFPISMDNSLRNPVLFEISDGSIAMVFRTGNYLKAYQTDLSEIHWGQENKDRTHSGLVSTLFTPLPQSGSLMPSNLVYNWPNPNNPGENFTHIRYYLNYDADITINIYDMAGDKVDELQDTGMAQADNETVWDLSDVSSGVYFARVEAKSGGQSAVEIIKIAVIK